MHDDVTYVTYVHDDVTYVYEARKGLAGCCSESRLSLSNSHKQMRGNLDVHKAAQAVVIGKRKSCFSGKKTGVVEPRNTKGTED